MDNWIEIARTGTFTDSQGRQQTFTEHDLSAIAGAYDPAKRDCPLVFGHPQSDSAPAYGWAEKLKVEGGKLLASFARVPEEVRKIVAAGHYRHVSMSLMPDRKTLRHVALLGAAQPAIDCLKAIELRSGDGCVTVDFPARDGGGRAAEISCGFAAEISPERHAGRHGRGLCDKDCLKAVELRSGEDCVTVDFSTSTAGNTRVKGSEMPDNDAQREIGALKERIAALEKENEGLKAQVRGHKEGKDKAEAEKKAAQEKEAKTAADFAAYRGRIENEKREARIAKIVEQGKLKPAEKAGVLQFAAALARQGETLDFAAPDGTVEKISLEEKYLRELEAREPDGRNMNFSAQPKHAGENIPAFDPSELTNKL